MRRTLFALLLFTTGLGSAHAADSDVVIVGGMDLGFKQLELDFDTSDSAFSPSFVTVNPNLGFSYGSFYASLSYDKSISAESTSDEDNVLGISGTKTDYARTDSTFTLGWRITESLSLFAGYLQGVSKINVTGARLVDPGPPPIFVVGVRDIEFKETGPFAGVGYGKNLGNLGTLAVSIGYADLDGELSVDSHPAGAGDFQVEGDTEGFSYGLTWSGILTGSLGYRVGFKATRYETKDLNNLTESYSSIYLGIMNYF